MERQERMVDVEELKKLIRLHVPSAHLTDFSKAAGLTLQDWKTKSTEPATRVLHSPWKS